jgi:hypothetical protein
MNRRCPSKLGFFVAFLVFAIVLVYLAFARRGPKIGHGSISLTYGGRTNIVAPFFYGTSKNLYLTGEFAVFTLQSRSTYYKARSIELKMPQGWVTNKTFSPDDGWPFNVADISQGKLVFWVPVPSTNAPWRIRFACTEKASGWAGVKDKAVDMWGNLRGTLAGDGGGQETFSGRHFEIISTVVSP